MSWPTMAIASHSSLFVTMTREHACFVLFSTFL
jgi:hypothetical protein